MLRGIFADKSVPCRSPSLGLSPLRPCCEPCLRTGAPFRDLQLSYMCVCIQFLGPNIRDRACAGRRDTIFHPRIHDTTLCWPLAKVNSSYCRRRLGIEAATLSETIPPEILEMKTLGTFESNRNSTICTVGFDHRNYNQHKPETVITGTGASGSAANR